MDTIWDTHPHRLNEAGLIRHSDNSVLTEDTDSFIIGNRVWVSGTKPGQIAYIGETQFAPGEWAGIVLDAPIGKNDGSVGGVRYFQCEPKRGVFSRLTRLTTFPLPGAEESFAFTTHVHQVSSSSLNNGTKQRGSSPLSPIGSTKNLRKSPSLSTSNTSLASATHVVDFKVGDRVIVKSSQGSKVGILRYMGTTSFASGEWCGVELDEPRGKNDGSIDGIRYFECKPQFGLFAPISKISKSPLKYKPGNCVLHSGAKPPNSGMKRAGSKESMASLASLTSSFASATSSARRVRLGVNSLTPQKIIPKSTVSNFPTRTALQDVLREKQLHIEQLLKEKDLERTEFTRAANQADDAEQKLGILRAEYEHYRAECETKLREYSSTLSQLNLDRGSLLSQLDDEKRKNEDLQFKFEEAAITKGDIEVSNESNIHQIRDLQEKLALEKQKVELLEQESSKLFETEEELVKSREENDALKFNIQHILRKRDVSAEENFASSETSSVFRRQTEINRKNIAIESTSSIQKDSVAVGIKTDQLKSLEFEKKLQESEKKSTQHLENCERYQNEIAKLNSELSQTKILIREQSSSMESKIKLSSDLESSMRVELERLRSELANKDQEIERKNEQLQTKDDEIRKLRTLLETTEIDVKAKAVDIERYKTSKRESEESYNKEIEYLKKMLKEKVVEKEQVETNSAVEINKQKSEIEYAAERITAQLEEIKKLKADLVEAKTDIERNSLDVHERHTRQIAIKESELMAMAAELQQKNEEISKCSIVTTKLEDDICIKNGIIEKLKLELESFKKRSENEERSMLNYTERISVLQLTIGDLQRKLASTEQLALELREQKARLETELQNVISSSGDYSSELQKLNAAVLEKELMLTTVRNEFLQKLQTQQSTEQQLQLQLQKIREDYQRNEVNLKEKIRISQESENMLRQRCESATGEAIKVRDELMIKVNQMQRLIEEKDFALKVSAGDLNESKRYLKEQLDRTTIELQKTIDSCQYKINELSTENVNVKNVIAQKNQELIENEAKLKHFITQSQLNEEELRRSAEEETKRLQFELSEKSAQVQQFVTELELLKRDCQTRNVDVAGKDRQISELSVQLQNTLELVNRLQIEKDNLQLAQIDVNKQCAIRNQQCTDLVNQVAVLSEKVEIGDKAVRELATLKTLHQQLIQQLEITQKQKLNLISRLEEEAKKNGDVEKCYYLLELAKNIQTSSSNEYTRKIVELQQLVQTTELKLQDSQIQLDSHKQEILSLQNQLLSTQQSCGPNGDASSNSVSNQSQYPAFLQTQLINLKNSYVQLLQRFVGSQKVNIYLINQLQRALSNGNAQNVNLLLSKFANLKNHLNTLRVTFEHEKFKFQKIISYALLNLQRKQVEIVVQNNFIKQLQNIYNSLPTQCKLLQSNTIKDIDSDLPNEAQIELNKTIQLLRVKDEHIQNLKMLLVSIQENCKKLFNAKCPNAESKPTNGIPQFSPDYCGPTRVLLKKVPIVHYVRQPCKQVYPEYIRNQPLIHSRPQGCVPGRTVVQKVPVFIPRIVIKQVPRYVNENFKCPAPQVIYQKIPIPLPPRLIVIDKPMPNNGDEVGHPTGALQIIRLQQLKINSLTNALFLCNKQAGVLYPNQRSDVAYLLSVIDNLRKRCMSSDISDGGAQCSNVLLKYKTLFDGLTVTSRDIWNILHSNGLSDNEKATMSKTKFENVVSQIKSEMVVSAYSGNGNVTPCTAVVQHTHRLNILRGIIEDGMPRLIAINTSPVKYVNILKITIQQLLSALEGDESVTSDHWFDNRTKCTNALIQQQVRIDLLRSVIQGLLTQFNNHRLADAVKLNILKAQIQNLLLQLRNNVNVDKYWPTKIRQCNRQESALDNNQLYVQMQNLIRQLNLCRVSNSNSPSHWIQSPLVSSAKLIIEENAYLKNQIRRLLIQPNTLDSNCRSGWPSLVPSDLFNNRRFKDIEIIRLKNLVDVLTQKLTNLSICNDRRCVTAEFIPRLPSPVQQIEMVTLKNQIRNLLMQLRRCKFNPTTSEVPIPDLNEVNALKLQIYELRKQLVYARLYPKCLPRSSPPSDLLSLQTDVPSSDNLVYHKCAPPSVIIKRIPIPQHRCARQMEENVHLKQMIQYLLNQSNKRGYISPIPKMSCIPERIVVPVPLPVDDRLATLQQHVLINSLHAKIQRLVIELNNLRLQYIEQCQKLNSPNSQNVLYLKQQIQQLLVQLSALQHRAIPNHDSKIIYISRPSLVPQQNQVHHLQQLIINLIRQLNLANRHPFVHNKPCLPQKVVVPNVKSDELALHVLLLQKQLQKLMVRLDNCKSSNPTSLTEISTFINQLRYFLQLFNGSSRLRIIVQPVPISQPVPPARIVFKPVYIRLPSPVKIVIRQIPIPQPIPVPQPTLGKNVPPPVLVPRPIPVTQQILVPQPIPIRVPSPVRVMIKPVYVPQASPIKILVRPVPVPQPIPVPLPSPVRVVIKPVYIRQPTPTPQPSPIRIIERPVSVPQPVPVPLPSPVRVVIKPVYIRQPTLITLPNPVPQPRLIFRPVYIRQPSQIRVVVRPVPVPQPVPVPLPQPPRLIIKPVYIPQPSKEKIIIRPVPVPLPAKEVIKRIYIRQPSQVRFITRPVPVPQPSSSRIIIKPVPQPVPVLQSLPPKIIIKPVYIPRPVPGSPTTTPRLILKPVYVPVIKASPPRVILKPVYIPRPVPIPQTATPKVILKPVYIPQTVTVPQPLSTKVVIKPVYIPTPVTVPQASSTKVVIKPVYIPQPVPVTRPLTILQQSPPKVILKPVYIPQTVTVPQSSPIKVVIKPMYIPHPVPVLRPISVPQPIPPKIVLKPVYIPQPSLPKVIIKPVYIPQPVTIPQSSSPKLIIKPVYIPQPVHVSRPVLVPSPPKVIFKPVYIPQSASLPQPSPTRLVTKPVYIPQPVHIFRPIPVWQPSPPKMIIKPVYVPQPSPPKVIIKPLYVPQPVLVSRPVPVVQQSPPQVILKSVYIPQPVNVPQPSATKVVMKPVYIPKLVHVPVPQPSPTKVILKPVYIPQPLPPKVIIKPVYVPQPVLVSRPVPVVQQSPPQVILKSVYIPQPVNVPQPSATKVVMKPVYIPQLLHVPVPQPSPPKVILKPVYIPQPVNVPQPSATKVVVKPVYIPQIVHVARPVPVVQQLPPQVILKPVYIHKLVNVPQPSPSKVVIKPMYIPQPVLISRPVPVVQQSPPKVLLKLVYVPQPSATKVVMKPVYIPQLVHVARPVLVPQPSPPKVILKPVYIPKPSPPKVVIKPVYVPQPVPVLRPVTIVQSSPPKVILKPVYIPQPLNDSQPSATKFVIKPVYIPHVVHVTRPVPVLETSSPKVILKPLYIRQPSSPKVVIKPVYIPQPVIVSRLVPVVQPSPPKVIVKPVYISQPSLPKVVIKPVYIPQPVLLPQSSTPKIIFKPVYIPRPVLCSQPTQPKVVIKPVYVPQPIPVTRPISLSQSLCPGVITKTVYVPRPVPVPQPAPPKLTLQPAPQSLTPTIVFKPVYIPHPVPVVRLASVQHSVPRLAPILQQSPVKIVVRPILISRPSRQQHQEIQILKTEIQNLLVELNKAYKRKIFINNCPNSKILMQRIPVYVPSLQNNEEIEFLKQQIQKLLVQLNTFSSIAERPDNINYVPTPNQKHEIDILKLQIQNLLRQINNLQNECFIRKQQEITIPTASQDCIRSCPISNIKYVPIVRQPKIIIKEIPIPISQKCHIPKVLIHNVNVPQAPKIIVKTVPVIQPPKVVIRKVTVPVGSSCSPPEVVIRKVPVFQPPKTILKQVPIIQPPMIVVKEVPVAQEPSIKIRYVPVPVIGNRNCPAPNVIIQKIPIPQPPRTIIKEVPISSPAQVVIKHVPVLQPPKVIVKKVPVFHGELCRQTRPPTTVIKEIPIPVPRATATECNVPKYVIQQVPVVQPPRIIIKTIPLKTPPREIVKTVLVPVLSGVTCPPPQVVTQRIPIVQIRTVIKEVPISQPPRIIIKQVPVQQPAQVIVKKIPVPVGQNVQCSTPQIVVERVEVPQPPRIIIKQVPVTLPPRVIIQEIPKYVCARSSSNQNSNTPEAVIKEIVVPTTIGKGCAVPKVILHNVPVNQPPRVVLKNVPILLPPKIIIKKVPVGPNVNCRIPEIIVRPLPIIQPPKIIVKEVVVPHPKIIVKEVPIIQPQIQVKYVPVAVAQNVQCPKPRVILQKVLVPQQPRTIVTEIPTRQPPRIIIKEVFVPRPPQIIVKEIPRIISDNIFSPSTSIRGECLQQMNALRLEVSDLTNRLGVCMRNSYPAEVNDIHSLPQCVSHILRQRVIIKNLNYKLKNLAYNSIGKSLANLQIPSVWKGINSNLPNKMLKPQFGISSTTIKQPSSQSDLTSSFLPSSTLNLPIPVSKMFRFDPSSKSTNGPQSLFLKVLHEAFSHTHKALAKCVNAIFIQQLATQTDSNGLGLDGNPQLMEEKQIAEGQIQFLNSIIVDMQRKSQEQQARIQLLESGFSPSAAEELKLYGVPSAKGHKRPPRLYCEICESFDQHETEDCPLQASGINFVDAPSTYSRRSRAAPSNRSYCEICEIFGHCTEDCKEDQTF